MLRVELNTEVSGALLDAEAFQLAEVQVVCDQVGDRDVRLEVFVRQKDESLLADHALSDRVVGGDCTAQHEASAALRVRLVAEHLLLLLAQGLQSATAAQRRRGAH